MTTKVIHESMFIVDDKIIAERGPALKTAVATAELLKPNGKVVPNQYYMGGVDSLGKTIVKGEKFSYLDSYADHVWYLFKKETVDGVEKTEQVGVVEGDQAAAEAAAIALL